MKYNFMKSRSSFGRIFGASVLALFMLMSAILVITLSPTTIEATEPLPPEFEYDFGDAPDSYNTTIDNNGAMHIMNSSGYYMGANVDNETDGQPSVNADGDDLAGIDDEDGLISLTSFKRGHEVRMWVVTHVPDGEGNGNLSAWVDFNRDGDWEDDGEQIFSDMSLGSDTYEVGSIIPCTAEVGWTYLRFRFSTDGNLSFDGFASDGEVEDYRVYINEDPPYPSQSIEFGTPFIMREWRSNDYYVIGPYTPVWINSSDMCPGTERIEYSVWVADDLEENPIVWTELWNAIVYDGGDDDLDDDFGSIVVEFYLDETCLHEVRYQCWDYDGASEGQFSEDFFVDKCPPDTTKVVGCPEYGVGWLQPPWASGITPIYFSSVDQCCLPNGTAVDKITIKVWWKYDTCDDSGAMNVIETIVVEDGDDDDTDPADGRIGYEFHFEQTGYYELEWWGEDMMGNVESHHKQQHRVDVDPPEITKTYPEGGYYEIEEHEGFIKCCSPINLTVEEMPDDTCNAGLYGMYWRYEWNETYYPAAGEEGAVNGQDIVDLFCNEDYDIYEYWWYPYDEEIHFLEECIHDLYYFAIDNVGNYDEVHHQVYYVDNTPPIAIKEIGEPKCQNELEGDDWCVKEETPIWINVTDNGTEPCIVGSVHLYYRIWYDGEWEDYYSYVPEGTLSEEIHLVNPCKHYLEFYVEDNVGNRWPVEGYHNETFYVDESPPIIIKTVGDPNCQFPESDDYCVNLSTLITLDAVEVGCCQNNSVTLEYRIWFGGEWTDWMPYVDPFNFTEECKHYLEVRASDCLGNKACDNETFYVDETPPEIIKIVGEPKCTLPDSDDYCVNLSTQITLDATNGGCCPNEEFTFEYRIWWEEQGWTNWMEYEGPFSFTEECMHYLEVRATDCLGNEAIDNETFYVDETPPEIIKTVGEPNCPIPGTDDYCVNLSTEITLDAIKQGCCQNGTVTLEYRIWWEEQGWTNWMEYEGPFSFTEECMHYLEVRATDCLGNEAIDNETFYVDETPPDITKTIGQPNCPVPETDDYCVNLSTEITLDAVEQGCCQNETIVLEYRIWWEEQGWTDWMSYEGPFNFTEECKHYLEVRATDCLGNEALDNETFYVDETPPDITKTVGEPNCPIPGTNNYCVNLSTHITLEAVDKGCCQNGTVTLEYRIWWDEGWTDDWMPYEGPFNFTEECMHYLEVRATDCLGNSAYDNETFYVDEQSPDIFKTIWGTNCTFSDLENPGFETGDFTDWTTESVHDSVTVVIADGYTMPFTGMYMARLGDDNGGYDGIQPIGDNAISQVFTATQDTFKFTYNIFTFDYTGYDLFYYILETADGVTTIADYSQTAWGINSGLKITGWTSVGIDVSSYIGEELKFIISCGGSADESYPTWAYVDFAPDYCVTTETMITVTTMEFGCGPCDNVTIEYRIWNMTDGWTEWMDYEEGISFDEECKHYLEIRAWDCLGNMDIDNETFYVDETPPDITKTVGQPNCPIPGTDDYCVNTSTMIFVEPWQMDCCPFGNVTVDYKIWNIDDGWTDWIPYENYISFDEECKHYLLIRASDCLGNEYIDNETFYVDETPPEIFKEVGEPNCPIPGTNNYCVNLSTEITLDATNGGCCVNESIKLEYRIWWEEEGWTDWMIYEGPFTFWEECKHYLEIRATDCLGNEAIDNETFYVDEQAPKLYKEVGDPHVYLGEDPYGHDIWLVYPETDICFNAVDQGCCEGGGTFIYYRYWYLGNWSDWMEYEGCINLEEGCVHYLEAYAVDCLGNAGEIDNETFWVCGPGGGSDDPNVEIIFPEHGSTQDTDVVEVILHAYDDETSWDDLGVYLWIPGGRRDAPFLYYDVTQLPGEEDYYHAFVPIYWYQGGAQITLEAIAIDEDGNTGVALPVTFKVDTTIVWDQWMQYGWNPLPLSGGMPPNFGCNESIESVMYSVNGSYDWVFHYDLDEGWISYYTERDINELTTIEGGKSYWVHIFNESGLRYYIGVGEIEILYPEDGAVLFDLNEINGTTWNSETGMEEVHVQIYYKDESNTKHYWDGSAWGMVSTYLPCDLEPGYIQNWSFDSSSVAWIPGETFYAKARAKDMFGCYAYDMVSFVFEEGCLCAPSIDLEKYVWDGDEWVNETEVFVEDVALFNISIANDGELIGSGTEYSTVNETILQAIDDGLAWLASQQNADGSVSSGYPVAYTGFAVLKWAEHATRFENKDPFDPTYTYSHNIEIGLNYLFNHSYNVTMTMQSAGDPDYALVNGNGIMFYDSYSRQTYETGIVLQAIVASDNPERVVQYGTHAGWTYLDVVKDVVDYISWSQVDSGSRRGAFGYTSSSGGDNSNSQWPILGLLSAGEWDIYAPTWIASENSIWTNYTQDLSGVPFTNPHYGSFGYSTPTVYNDHDLTASGMIQLIYQKRVLGIDISARITAAINWIDHAWDWPHSGSYWYENVGRLYAMYAVMKASLLNSIEYYGSHDWQEEYDDWLIANQYGDGHWYGDYWIGHNDILDTAFALLILQRIAPGVVSDCPPCNLSEWYINDTLPEGLEYVENSTKIIVMSCEGYFESSGPEVQPEITYNLDGTTTLEWEEDGDEPFNLTLCTTMYLYFNATVLDCEAPDGHINTAYITAYSPDDESWVSDEDTATVWGDCGQPV